MAEHLRLIGDIGGTNARFTIARDGEVRSISTLSTTDHPSFESAIAAYLASHAKDLKIAEAAFAVAGPVSGDWVALTNHNWAFSQDALRTRFGFDRLRIFNDFAAIALAIPHLDKDSLEQVGGGRPDQTRPKGVIGPGTGLGVTALVPDGSGGWIVTPGEGGHVTMAPANSRESRLLEILRQRVDHVSAERVLSGDGLVHLYETLCEMDGRRAPQYKPSQITDAAVAEADSHCREAVETFCAMLGTIAGNLALTLGAMGGVYIAGGIVPRLGRRFTASGFRTRFEAKGRFREYLAPIPTYVIAHGNPALLGLAKLPMG
jgi:glucokinase